MAEQYNWKTSKEAYEILKGLFYDHYQGTKKFNVNELAGLYNKDKSVISRQLSCLKDAGLIKAKKSGKEKYYGLNVAKLRKEAGTKDKQRMLTAFLTANNFNSFKEGMKLLNKAYDTDIPIADAKTLDRARHMVIIAQLWKQIKTLEAENKRLKKRAGKK